LRRRTYAAARQLRPVNKGFSGFFERLNPLAGSRPAIPGRSFGLAAGIGADMPCKHLKYISYSSARIGRGPQSPKKKRAERSRAPYSVCGEN